MKIELFNLSSNKQTTLLTFYRQFVDAKGSAGFIRSACSYKKLTQEIEF